METRKGILTPEQEKTLEGLVKLNNKIAESLDGPAITLIDNQLIERLKAKLEVKYPGATVEFVYPIVDVLFDSLAVLADEKAE